MATLNRYRVLWTGGPGGPGVSTFYAPSDETSALADIRAFFAAVAAQFPNVFTWTFPNTGDTINSDNGQVNGAWSESAAANVSGAAGAVEFAAGVGLSIRWETGAIIGGRRVRGRTFLTGLATGVYQADGTIVPGVLGPVQAAADDLVDAGWLTIWSRPGPNGSGTSSVQSATIPDRVSWLSTRRT